MSTRTIRYEHEAGACPYCSETAHHVHNFWPSADERSRAIQAIREAMMDDGPWWMDEPLELDERAERVLDAVLDALDRNAR